MKRAVFPGSFDPFTTGHYNIVCRGLKLFDEVIIGIGVNGSKQCMLTPDERLQKIRRTFKNEPRVRVETYDCLTVDFASQHEAQFILRGIRSVKDFEYERELADINKKLSGIETILLYSEPEYSSISSSMVRELHKFGKETDEFTI